MLNHTSPSSSVPAERQGRADRPALPPRDCGTSTLRPAAHVQRDERGRFSTLEHQLERSIFVAKGRKPLPDLTASHEARRQEQEEREAEDCGSRCSTACGFCGMCS